MKLQSFALSLLTFVTLLGSGFAAGPPFSWDTVAVYSHMCNKTGPFDAAIAQALARFPIVTVEKGQSVDQDGWAEDKIVAALKQIRDINPNVHTVMYLNSVLNWDQYKLSQLISSDPKYQLFNASNLPVRQAGDHTFKQPPDGMLIYGFDQEPARQAWSDTCMTAVATGYVNSCFSDRSTEDSFHRNTLSPDTAARYAAGHQMVQQDLQKALDAKRQGGFVVANNGVVPGARAAMIEPFAATNSSIEMVFEYQRIGFANNTAQPGTQYDQRFLLEVHAGYKADGSDNHCKDGVTNSLSAFLIAAGPNTYYGCSSGWIVSNTDRQWVHWWPEYSKPLGPPKADATYDGASRTWRREFGQGTVVTFNTTDNTGTISWSDGTVSKGTAAL